MALLEAPAQVDGTSHAAPPGGNPPEPPAAPPAHAAAPGRRRLRAPRRRRVGLLGDVLALLGLLLVAFVAIVGLLGPLKQARDQEVLYDRFRAELAEGTAPVSQLDAFGALVKPGAPVAWIRIPVIGLNQVVVEGTTATQLQSAPGHRRDTVMPGQPGVSLLYGRQAMYGGPFGRLAELQPGARIEVTTGQGESTYSVIGIRRAGDPIPEAVADGGGRITLQTADGTPYAPDGTLRVDADLVSEPFAAATPVFGYSSLAQNELAMEGDRTNTFLLVLVGEALLLAALVFAWVRVKWGRGQAWLVGMPVLLVLVAFTSDLVAQLLPNLM